MQPVGPGVAMAVLNISSQLVDGIQEGLAARGFDDVRPAHGFAFALISETKATTAQLAQHLGITKQAASQMVDQLVRRGYLEREADPDDGRARLLVLTDRGRACTVAAEQAATDVVEQWRSRLTRDEFEILQSSLQRIAVRQRLRPSW